MLPHEKLDNYRKALEFVGTTSTDAAFWDKRHSVADQFGKASDSPAPSPPLTATQPVIVTWPLHQREAYVRRATARTSRRGKRMQQCLPPQRIVTSAC